MIADEKVLRKAVRNWLNRCEAERQEKGQPTAEVYLLADFREAGGPSGYVLRAWLQGWGVLGKRSRDKIEAVLAKG